MQCQTLKPGVECLFMKKTGCGYNGGRCYEVVENCDGCSRIMVFDTGKFCASFPYPAQKWQNTTCSMATHVKRAVKQEEQKINPLKASKRNAGKK